jgi:proteasome lid subunit RPN8/RPN11
MTTVRLPEAVRQEIVAHARDAMPSECCGVLIGRSGSIVESVRVPNIAGDPNRYLLDHKGHIEARRRARTAGLDVLGFYHSHTHSPAEPSAADVAEAAYPGALYVIVSLATEPPDVGVFRFDKGGFVRIDPLLP